ncbi:tetratricopeptide repeat protein [Paraburkholderia phenazinium]|jgi:tetratricopeptide (TPR) repeat protein|uniref:Tfp pilus assembly protein PilF n=1 Tax=Paraburkholderia phenazinium TaxID=60549 RepID=A0A1G7Q5E5_9BURK|nr:tetratricopeptide repeat protein [Paraburkholderia phenazinium]SDF92820.1 Tfp pilus assembly protein PilF [Paraburkholderia phenazinium]
MEQHLHSGDARHDAAAPSYLAAVLAHAFDLHRAGQLDQAAPLYQEALAIDPRQAEALHYFGVLQHQRGAHRAAADLLDQALELEPADAVCWSNRGLVAAALGQHDEAERCYWQALQLHPKFADARNNLGVTLQAQGELEGAVRQYREAIALQPLSVDAHLNLGTALAKLERYDEALEYYEQALALDPYSAEAHFSAGNALNAKGDSAAAIARFRRAIELRPGFANAHVNLGSAIGKLGNYAEAEQQYRYAVALKPNPTNLVCLGGSLGAQGRLDEEEVFYRRALEIDPGYVDAHQNLAWLLLKRGDYAQGWAEFAKRWRPLDYAAIAVEGVPEWHGEPLDGRRILLVGDQGFGDQLQFLRFARVLEQLGAEVDVCVREPLVPLAERVPGVHRAWSGKAEGRYDFWAPLMSVPSCIGTEVATIPADVPYLFADEAKVQAWRERVASVAGSRRKVGLVWAGSPTFGNDRYRSMHFADLAPLGELKDIAWFSLQKGPAEAQLVEAPEAFRPYDFSAELHDFTETAALVMNLDQVIAVDTGVAHLTGALGKPVWIMLPANSDWRWLERRSDSPWYPAARLFRQGVLGDWKPLVKSVVEALRQGKKQ